MIFMSRKTLAVASTVAMLLSFFPTIAPAGEGARLEGLLVGVDGKPAAGYNVLLIGEEGEVLDRTEAAGDGIYRFSNLASGSYSLGLETPDGLAAPVMNGPTDVKSGQLVRMDIKLMRQDAVSADDSKKKPAGIRIWWAGLSRTAKTWTLVGVSVATVIIINALDDEDPASPHEIDGD